MLHLYKRRHGQEFRFRLVLQDAVGIPDDYRECRVVVQRKKKHFEGKSTPCIQAEGRRLARWAGYELNFRATLFKRSKHDTVWESKDVQIKLEGYNPAVRGSWTTLGMHIVDLSQYASPNLNCEPLLWHWEQKSGMISMQAWLYTSNVGGTPPAVLASMDSFRQTGGAVSPRNQGGDADEAYFGGREAGQTSFVDKPAASANVLPRDNASVVSTPQDVVSSQRVLSSPDQSAGTPVGASASPNPKWKILTRISRLSLTTPPPTPEHSHVLSTPVLAHQLEQMGEQLATWEEDGSRGQVPRAAAPASDVKEVQEGTALKQDTAGVVRDQGGDQQHKAPVEAEVEVPQAPRTGLVVHPEAPLDKSESASRRSSDLQSRQAAEVAASGEEAPAYIFMCDEELTDGESLCNRGASDTSDLRSDLEADWKGANSLENPSPLPTQGPHRLRRVDYHLSSVGSGLIHSGGYQVWGGMDQVMDNYLSQSEQERDVRDLVPEGVTNAELMDEVNRLLDSAQATGDQLVEAGENSHQSGELGAAKEDDQPHCIKQEAQTKLNALEDRQKRSEIEGGPADGGTQGHGMDSCADLEVPEKELTHPEEHQYDAQEYSACHQPLHDPPLQTYPDPYQTVAAAASIGLQPNGLRSLSGEATISQKTSNEEKASKVPGLAQVGHPTGFVEPHAVVPGSSEVRTMSPTAITYTAGYKLTEAIVSADKEPSGEVDNKTNMENSNCAETAVGEALHGDHCTVSRGDSGGAAVLLVDEPALKLAMGDVEVLGVETVVGGRDHDHEGEVAGVGHDGGHVSSLVQRLEKSLSKKMERSPTSRTPKAEVSSVKKQMQDSPHRPVLSAPVWAAGVARSDFLAMREAEEGKLQKQNQGKLAALADSREIEPVEARSDARAPQEATVPDVAAAPGVESEHGSSKAQEAAPRVDAPDTVREAGPVNDVGGAVTGTSVIAGPKDLIWSGLYSMYEVLCWALGVAVLPILVVVVMVMDRILALWNSSKSTVARGADK